MGKREGRTWRTMVPAMGCALMAGCAAPPAPEAGTRTADTLPAPRTDTVPAAAPPAVPLEWRALKGDGSVLVFNTGDTLRTGLFDIGKLGHVIANGVPYVLLGGRTCDACPVERSMYVLRTDAREVRTGALSAWHLPGRLLDGETGEAYYEAEVYSGEVLPDTVGVIWYERQVLPDGGTKENTTLLRLNGARPDTLVFFGRVRKPFTQGLAFRGACRRLPEVDQTSAP